ncbi:MAG: uncharacterized protein QG670_2230 [Thermoproteota archaeon]|nr:uncharacterized protein [Thermoproteota archaeon]
MPLKVILDSNFLMIPAEFHLDIFSELDKILNRKIQEIIISPVYDELKWISQNSDPKQRRQAELTLKLIARFEITCVKSNTNETVDDLILRLAKEWQCPVATNDRKLLERLRVSNVPVIYLRQRTHLAVEGLVT